MESREIVWHIFAIIGAIQIAIWVLPWLYRFLFCGINLKNYKYGFVLITGSTDGIGKSFAKEFARKGFKLLLISRNQEKLESVKQEISSQYPGNIVEIIACDFSNSHKNPEIFYEDLYQQIKNYDISVLINNVGVTNFNPLMMASFSDLENVISVNVYPSVFLTHKLMPGFIQKFQVGNRKSLIINLSSGVEDSVIPGFITYSATKRFNNFFSEGLRYEYNEIEVVTVKPGPISTQLLRQGGDLPLQCSSDTYVKSLLSGLRTSANRGHWKSRLFYYITGIWPYMLDILTIRLLMPIFIKIGLMKKGY